MLVATVVPKTVSESCHSLCRTPSSLVILFVVSELSEAGDNFEFDVPSDPEARQYGLMKFDFSRDLLSQGFEGVVWQLQPSEGGNPVFVPQVGCGCLCWVLGSGRGGGYQLCSRDTLGLPGHYHITSAVDIVVGNIN